MMKKFLSFTVLLALLAFTVSAQENAVRSYTLKEAVEFALDHNKAIKNAKLDELSSKARNWEILTTGMPQISGSVDYSYYFKVPQVPAITKVFSDPNGAFSKLLTYFDTSNRAVKQILDSSGGSFSNISFVLPHTLSAGVQLSQLIFDARYLIGVKATKQLMQSSRLSRQMSEQDIRNTVAKAYYQAEAAQEARSLLQENMKLLDKLVNDTRAVYNQGLTEELDVDRLELGKATLESQINIQNQMADVALVNLKFQMGLPLNDEIILRDKLEDMKSNAGIALENKFDPSMRLEYELLNTAVILKGYDVAQKRSGYFPYLVGFLNYSWNVQAQNFSDIFTRFNQYNSDGSVSRVSPWYPQGTIGFSLKVPIFDAGQKLAQVKQAKFEEQKTKNELENFKAASELQFKVAQSTLHSALMDEATTQKTVDLSKKIFNKNQIKFNAGAGSSFELVQSEQDYTTNLLKHVQSVTNLLNAKADLDKAMGVK